MCVVFMFSNTMWSFFFFLTQLFIEFFFWVNWVVDSENVDNFFVSFKYIIHSISSLFCIFHIVLLVFIKSLKRWRPGKLNIMNLKRSWWNRTKFVQTFEEVHSHYCNISSSVLLRPRAHYTQWDESFEVNKIRRKGCSKQFLRRKKINDKIIMATRFIRIISCSFVLCGLHFIAE